MTQIMNPTASTLTEDGSVLVTNSQDWKDLLARIERADAYTKAWHDNIQRWRKLYNMEHYRKPGRINEILYNDPTYTNTVDLAVGIMLGNDLRWHAFGMRPSKQEQMQTGWIEKLIDGTLTINGEREEVHITYRLFLDFCRDGGGCFYSIFDPMIAEECRYTSPDEQGMARHCFSEVPVRTKVIDPLTLLLLPGGPKKWLLMGRKESRSVLDVETVYGVKFEKWAHMSQQEKSQIKGVFYDIWDYVWITEQAPQDNPDTQTTPAPAQRKMVLRNTIIFENIPVVGPRRMDGYKDMPYTVQFFKPVGDDSGEWASILTPLESSVAMLERSFNRRAKQIDIYTALPLIAKTQPGRKVIIDPGLYNSIQLAPDESIEFPRWPGNAPDVQMHQDFLRARIQQSGFSDVMFGSGNSQVAGYALSQLGDQNRIRLEQPIQHLELLLTMWAKKTLSLLQTYATGSLISVFGQQKGKSYMDNIDLNALKGYSIKAEIRPNFPNEEMRKVAMSTQAKGTLSEYTRMERYFGIEQPEDEQQRKLIEAAQNHPIAQMYALISVLQEEADSGDKAAAMTLQAIQQQGIPGQPGRPTEPNNAAPPTGLASQTGMEPTGGENPSEPNPMQQQQDMGNQAPDMGGGMIP